MASPEEVAQLLPETLPEDFSEWDGEASPAAVTANSSGLERTRDLGETPKPPGSAEREAILASVLDRTREPRSVVSAPIIVKQQQKGFRAPESKATAAPVRNKSVGLEGGQPFGETPKPSAKPADREAIVSPVADRPRSGSPAPDSFKPQKFSTTMVDKTLTRLPDMIEPVNPMKLVPVAPSWRKTNGLDEIGKMAKPTATMAPDAGAALFQSFSANTELMGEEKTARKKWMIIAAVSACSILLLLLIMIPLFHHGTKSVAKQSVPSYPGASETQLTTNTPKPSAMEPLTHDKAIATTAAKQTADNELSNEEEDANPARVQTEMMNDQLTAPTRIPQDIKKQVADDAPPPVNLGTAGLAGSGTIDTVFNGHGQPIIKAAKPVAISAGVATGLLINRTLPIYPPIAKATKVSGTVVLQATISKTGTIKDLQVVSGPAMLRQAALDAVRNWRYKPYKLNNEPTDVQTTVNVIFTL